MLKKTNVRKRKMCTGLWRCDQFEQRVMLSATMVYDINTNPADSSPLGLTAVNDTLFFTAAQGKYRQHELWKSDGTDTGTVQVSDRPGSPVLQTMAAVGSKLFFFTGGSFPSQLWSSDGTDAGTNQIASVSFDNSAATYYGTSGPIATIKDRYFFSGHETTTIGNSELWVSDGTSAGTIRVKDINTGSGSSSPRLLTSAGTLLYFVADDGSSGIELWKSDGSETGTGRVADIRPGSKSSNLGSLTAMGNSVYFFADDGVNGYGFWRSDGTGPGTVRLANASKYQNGWSKITVVGDTLFFNVDNQLWKSDGTAGGTVVVATIPNNQFQTFTEFEAIGNTLYFVARDSHGYELWRSDGTGAGTRMVKDLYPGSYPDVYDFIPRSLTKVGNLLYFIGDVTDLWCSNGTEAGTTIVKSFEFLSTQTLPENLTAVSGQLFLRADDAQFGHELWRTDGTALGTRIVKDIRPGTASSEARALDSLGGKLLVEADSFVREVHSTNTRLSVWATDGTKAAPAFLTQLGINGWPTGVEASSVLANDFYFVAKQGIPRQLWKTDGTPAGTQVVKSVEATEMKTLGSRIFLGGNYQELSITDGTTQGTMLLKDIWPGSGFSSPGNFTALANTLIFTANDGTSGNELWKSDGTAAGTVRIKDINLGPGASNPKSLTIVGNSVYFIAGNGSKEGLWKSDGTETGTVLLKSYQSAFDKAENLTAFGEKLFFPFNSGSGTELWVSDGTAAGTVQVKDIFAGQNGSYPRELTVVGSSLFFTATSTQIGGRELWKSDGTIAGTQRVMADIWGLYGDQKPHNLTAVGNLLYFVADTGTTGNELWQSDGTAVGTVLVSDIWPGSSGSDPSSLISHKDTLFFTADDGFHGRELWKVVVNNYSPVFTSSATPSVIENISAVLTTTATDADRPAQPITYSLSGGVDRSSFSITSAGALRFVVAPDFERPADANADNVYQVQVTANDGYGRTTTQDLFVTVTPANDNNPVFTSSAIPRVPENTTSVLTITATDADLPAQSIRYSLTGGADQSKFSITSGGVLKFVVAPNFENPVDANVDNVYLVRVMADDGNGRTTAQNLAVTVTSVNDNSPVFTSSAAPSAAENTISILTATATDADLPAQTLTYSLTGGADQAKFQISSGGVLTFAIAPDFETPTDANADNVYQVQVTANDGNGGTTTQNLSVKVIPTNDSSPVFTSSAVPSVPENTASVLTIKAFDADLPAQSIRYSLSGGADHAKFSISSEGEFMFVAAPNFENPTDANADNVYLVRVTADDGNGRTTAQDLAVTVTAVNDNNPVFTSSASPSVPENSTAVLFVSATDADLPSQTLTYSLTGGTDQAKFQITSGGMLTFVSAPDFENPTDADADNVYLVQITANDGDGGSTPQNLSVVVNPSNDNIPVILSPTDTTSDLAPQITWQSHVGAASFDVWISNLSTNTSPVRRATVVGTTYVAVAPLGIGLYRVWVRSFDDRGTPSVWSFPKTFRINTPVTLHVPDRIQPTPRPTISWDGLPGAVRFDLWIDNRTTGQTQFIRNQNITTTSWAPPTDLPLGTYRAWLRGIDAAGTPAQWSLAVEFTVATPPRLTSPLNSTFNRRPTFTWDAVTGATKYEVQVRNLTTGMTAYNQTNIAATNWTPPSSLSDGPYRWWAAAVGANNVRGMWTAPIDFNIGGLTILLTPIGSNTDTTPMFSWQPVDGAARYELWVTHVGLNARLIHETNLTTLTYTPASALEKGTYRAWVRAIRSSGEVGPWSSQANFEIAAVESMDADLSPDPVLLTSLQTLEPLLVDSRGDISNETLVGNFADREWEQISVYDEYAHPEVDWVVPGQYIQLPVDGRRPKHSLVVQSNGKSASEPMDELLLDALMTQFNEVDFTVDS